MVFPGEKRESRNRLKHPPLDREVQKTTEHTDRTVDRADRQPAFVFFLTSTPVLPHELVPVHFRTLVDTHYSPRLLFCFAIAPRPAAELAPLLHHADELLLAPRLLAGVGALASHEAGGLAYVRHATIIS